MLNYFIFTYLIPSSSMRLGLCQILLVLIIIRDLLCAKHIARCFTNLVSCHLWNRSQFPRFTDKETEVLTKFIQTGGGRIGLETQSFPNCSVTLL